MLNQGQIEYLLIGGYAVALYGAPRPTKDLDVWVSASDENLDRLIIALEQFGFEKGSIHRDLFRQGQRVFRMGVVPNRLEILTQIAGVEFADCYRRRRRMVIDEIEVPVIDLNDLLANKAATGRPRDLDDVRKLRAGLNP